ncbi:MAG TPA: LacI family DNA-binding transcriptional regulator [Chryseolinea sp.]|nr:LacI family DNA-binding transcriptional regulator [Chryseolinea sp.]
MSIPHHVTIKDIAQQLKVSISTVSRALRCGTDINEETRKLIQGVAKELNYSPNPIALSLKDKKTKVIGVIVQEIANNYCSSTIAGIEDYACKKGYNVLISQSHEKFDAELAATRLMASRRVDGLLISLSNETRQVDHLKEIIEMGVPVVMFDRVSDNLDTHKVVVDDYQGAFDLTAHLIESGYEQIAHLTISKHLAITQNRLKGFLDACKAHNVKVNNDWIVYCDFNGRNIRKEIRKLLKGSHRPDALFCSVERLTMACIKELRDMGLRIPGDVALAGFSDNTLTPYLNPPLTSVIQPTFAIGQKAARLLIELIENKTMPISFKTIRLKTSLSIQDSTRALATGWNEGDMYDS